MPAYKPIAERFATKYEINGETGCWEWTGSTVAGGYGLLGGERGSGNLLAHRFSYEHHVGPIPFGLIVLHSCDTPACVNPKHLSVGTHPGNMKDMERKGRARLLTQQDVKEIAGLRKSGASAARVAAMYGVSPDTILRTMERAERGDYGPEVAAAAFERPVKYTRLSESDREEALRMLAAGERVMAVAKRFGVDRKTIRNIRPAHIASPALGRPRSHSKEN